MLAAKINGILQHTEDVVKEIAGNNVRVRVVVYVREQSQHGKYGIPFKENRAKVIHETLEFNGIQAIDEAGKYEMHKIAYDDNRLRIEFAYEPGRETKKQQLERKKMELEAQLAAIHAEEEKQNKEFNDAMDAAAYGHYMINDVEVAGDGTESA